MLQYNLNDERWNEVQINSYLEWNKEDPYFLTTSKSRIHKGCDYTLLIRVIKSLESNNVISNTKEFIHVLERKRPLTMAQNDKVIFKHDTIADCGRSYSCICHLVEELEPKMKIPLNKLVSSCFVFEKNGILTNVTKDGLSGLTHEYNAIKPLFINALSNEKSVATTHFKLEYYRIKTPPNRKKVRCNDHNFQLYEENITALRPLFTAFNKRQTIT